MRTLCNGSRKRSASYCAKQSEYFIVVAIPELTGVPQGLDSAAKIACKEQQDFYVKHNGGYTLPTHSKIGQGMIIHFEKLLDEYGKNELIPVCLENDTPNFYLNHEVQSEETHSVRDAEQYYEKEGETGMAERIACKSNSNSESSSSHG